MREPSRILNRMGLTYHFEFKAPATTTAGELESFLRGVEQEAKAMGFRPTLVLNAVFDSTERKQFARLLTPGLRVEDARLKGADVPRDHVKRPNPRFRRLVKHFVEAGYVGAETDEFSCATG